MRCGCFWIKPTWPPIRNLWGKVTDAMDRSRYLIVVLSPYAAASGWVDKEVAYWLEQRGPDQLLIVLAQGHLHWDEATARFDPDRSDAALQVLTEPGVLAAEPLHVDVSGDAPWDLQAPGFRDKVTDLAAPIHGKSKYELTSDDVREQRRFRRLRRAAIIGLANAYRHRGRRRSDRHRETTEANLQRLEANPPRNEAVARGLVSEAQSMLVGGAARDSVGSCHQASCCPAHLAEFRARRDAHCAESNGEVVPNRPGPEWSVLERRREPGLVTTESGAQVLDTETGDPVGVPFAAPGDALYGRSPDGR